MGIPDTVDRTIEKVATGFQGNPLCLAAVLLSAMFAVLIYFTLTEERREAHERTLKIIDRCFPATSHPAPVVIPDSYIRSDVGK